MSTFFDSFDSPQLNEQNPNKLPAQETEDLPSLIPKDQIPVQHTNFQPNYILYSLIGLALIIIILLLHLLAEWSFGRIFWGTFFPMALGNVIYYYIEPPYRDNRVRQVAAITGFGLAGLFGIVHHLLIPLLNSNQPVHLYLIAIIIALSVVTRFFYREGQRYKALAVGLLATLLLIATLSFWHKWTGRYHNTSTGDSWRKYSVF